MTTEIQPLVLADGTRINPITGELVEEREAVEHHDELPTDGTAPSADEFDVDISKLDLVGKNVATRLPERGQRMAVIAAVVSLELWGLPPGEIAKVLETDAKRVEALQHTDTYLTYREAVANNLMRALDDDVRGLFAKHAKKAAEKLIDGLSAKDQKSRMGAANSILDRAGFGAKSVVEHNHKMDDELVIRVIRDDKQDLPTIEVPVIEDV